MITRWCSHALPGAGDGLVFAPPFLRTPFFFAPFCVKSPFLFVESPSGDSAFVSFAFGCSVHASAFGYPFLSVCTFPCALAATLLTYPPRSRWNHVPTFFTTVFVSSLVATCLVVSIVYLLTSTVLSAVTFAVPVHKT